MGIEYVVESKEELDRLEKAMAAFPCVITPNSLVVSGTGSTKEVIISPRYGGIERIASNEGVLLRDLNLTDSSRGTLILQMGEYSYLINLKPKNKDGR